MCKIYYTIDYKENCFYCTSIMLQYFKHDKVSLNVPEVYYKMFVSKYEVYCIIGYL